MKNYKEAHKEYVEISTELKEISAILEKYYKDLHAAADLSVEEWKKQKAASIEAIQEHEANKKTLEIALKYAHDNKRAAFMAEALPIFCSVWNKYAGKRYGDKTKEKITEGLKNLQPLNIPTFCAIITNRYSDSTWCALYTLTAEGFTSYEYGRGDLEFYANKPLLIDNVIQEITPEEVKTMNAPTITADPIAAAERLQTAYNKLFASYTEYAEEVNAYNNMLPRGINKLNVTSPATL